MSIATSEMCCVLLLRFRIDEVTAVQVITHIGVCVCVYMFRHNHQNAHKLQFDEISRGVQAQVLPISLQGKDHVCICVHTYVVKLTGRNPDPNYSADFLILLGITRNY